MGFLITFVELFFRILQFAILVRVLLSWINPNPYHPLVQILYQITDPILVPIRRIIPPFGMLDLSPIVAFIVLDILERVILSILLSV
jgi:YggT family protein